MKITQAINELIEERSYTSYLEIGYKDGITYDHINCEHKKGVFHRDEYTGRKKFDLIFIDGEHSYEQVEEDFEFALTKLKKNGMIVFHDINPPTKWHARPVDNYQYPEEWCGQAIHIFIEKIYETGYESFTMLDVPFGLGIIDTSIEKDWDEETKPITFDDFTQFIQKIKK